MRDTTGLAVEEQEIKHFHICCGAGGAARGFNLARPRVGTLRARYRCLGGVDVDPEAVANFQRLAGVPGTVLDLFTRELYKDFHGRDPDAGWREATPADLRRAAGQERPDTVFISAPCQGGSGLLPQEKARSAKYQALNALTLRAVFLLCEAWKDDPPAFIVFENVRLLAHRARHLLDQIGSLLRSYGYAVAESVHDCGVLAGLAQSRPRFLLLARHMAQVPPFLYEPPRRALRGIGEVLGRMPLPGDVDRGGPSHRIPELQWGTWLRIALVRAGSDWRSLNELAVCDGRLRDHVVVAESRNGFLGVLRWDEHCGTVAGRTGVTNGAYAVADPRMPQSEKWHDGAALGVLRWDEPIGTIAGQQSPGQGAYCVSDPRVPSAQAGLRFVFTRPSREAGVAAASGGQAPQGLCAGAIPLPARTQKLVAIIRAPDATWHRPLTVLELAALQDLFDPAEHWSDDPVVQAEIDERTRLRGWDGLTLIGTSQRQRTHVGNMVPPGAARAIAEVIGEAILLARAGETFVLGSTPIWVRPIARAVTMAAPGEALRRTTTGT